MASTTKAADTPPFGPEHAGLRAEMRSFVDEELRPNVAQWEEDGWVPDEAFRKTAEKGYFGLKYEPEYGGTGGGYVHEAVWSEELARCGSGGTGAALGGHANIATPPIWKFGTEEQKQRWLVPAIKADKIGALGITEPDAGSDVAGLKTHAKRVEGGWIVNGSKTFITNGVRADFMVTAVKTTPEGGHHGLTFFVLEKDMEGYTVSRKLEKLGWRASDTGELAFQDVFVPEENLLGEVNKGFYLIMANFQWERLGMALGAVGKMGWLVERAVELAGGRPGQATRHRVAQMAVTYETDKALTYHALRLFLNGEDALREVSMAKLQTQRHVFWMADSCLQLSGPDEYIERALRDARLGPIGGGSDEIMKEILGRQLGL